MKSKHLKILPFAIAALLNLVSLIAIGISYYTIAENGSNTHYSLDYPLISATIALFLIFVLIKLNQAYWKHAFFVLLLVGLSPLIQFSFINFSIGIGPMIIDPFALLLLLFHLYKNQDMLDFLQPKSGA